MKFDTVITGKRHGNWLQHLQGWSMISTHGKSLLYCSDPTKSEYNKGDQVYIRRKTGLWQPAEIKQVHNSKGYYLCEFSGSSKSISFMKADRYLSRTKVSPDLKSEKATHEKLFQHWSAEEVKKWCSDHNHSKILLETFAGMNGRELTELSREDFTGEMKNTGLRPLVTKAIYREIQRLNNAVVRYCIVSWNKSFVVSGPYEQGHEDAAWKRIAPSSFSAVMFQSIDNCKWKPCNFGKGRFVRKIREEGEKEINEFLNPQVRRPSMVSFGSVGSQASLSIGRNSSDTSINAPLDPRLLSAILKEGIMQKKAKHNRHLWQARYFRLLETCLVYYKNQENAINNISPTIFNLVEIIQVIHAKTGEGSSQGVRMNMDLTGDEGKRTVLELKASSREDCLKWISTINEQIKDTKEEVDDDPEILSDAGSSYSYQSSYDLQSSGGTFSGAISFIQEDEWMNTKILKEGLLEKKAKKNRHLWQLRYFKLYETCMVYYKHEKNAIDNRHPTVFRNSEILHVHHAKTGEGSSEGVRMNIIMLGDQSKRSRLELKAQTKKDCLKWISLIDDAMKKAKAPIEETNEDIPYSPNWHSYSVKISEYKTVDLGKSTEFVMFIIVIREFFESTSYQEWKVERRFSEFKKLNGKLREKFTRIPLPTFPKSAPKKNQTKIFLQKRRMELQRYLQKVISSSILHVDELSKFLMLGDPMRQIKMGCVDINGESDDEYSEKYGETYVGSLNDSSFFGSVNDSSYLGSINEGSDYLDNYDPELF